MKKTVKILLIMIIVILTAGPIYAGIEAEEGHAIEATSTSDFEDILSEMEINGEFTLELKNRSINGEGIIPETVNYYIFESEEVKAEAIEAAENGGDNFDMAAFADSHEGIKRFSTIDKEYSYFYSNPWNESSDKILVYNVPVYQENLKLKSELKRESYTSTIEAVINGEDDDFVLGSARATFENGVFDASYSTKNKTINADYILSEQEFNGVNVYLKKVDLNTFFGEVQGKSIKFVWDAENLEFDPVADSVKNFYAFGVQKDFHLFGFAINSSLVSRRGKESDDKSNDRSILAFSTDKSFFNTDFYIDLAYSIPIESDEEKDTIVLFGFDRDLGLTQLEFNYKNIGKDFQPLQSDTTLFTADNEDYDQFSNNFRSGTSSANILITPRRFYDIESSIFYTVVNDQDDKNNYKGCAEVKIPVLVDGLTVGGSYEDVRKVDGDIKITSFNTEYLFLDEYAYLTYDYINENYQDDVTITTILGGNYTFLADRLRVYFDYQIEQPEYDTIIAVEEVGNKPQKTTTLGAKYNFNNYISTDFEYTTVVNNGHLAVVEGESMYKKSNQYGIYLDKYPVYGIFISSSYVHKNIDGYKFDYNEAAATLELGDDLNVITDKYSLGLDYQIGVFELGYDGTYTLKEGTGEENGNYTTHKFGVEYSINDNIALSANYEILKLDAEDTINDLDDYLVEMVTLGFNILF